jgi:histone H3/H4
MPSPRRSSNISEGMRRASSLSDRSFAFVGRSSVISEGMRRASSLSDRSFAFVGRSSVISEGMRQSPRKSAEIRQNQIDETIKEIERLKKEQNALEIRIAKAQEKLQGKPPALKALDSRRFRKFIFFQKSVGALIRQIGARLDCKISRDGDVIRPIQSVVENLIAETVRRALSYTESRDRVTLETDDVRKGLEESVAQKYKFPFTLAQTIVSENNRRRQLPNIYYPEGPRFVKHKGMHDEFTEDGFRRVSMSILADKASTRAGVKINDDRKVVEVQEYRISEDAFHMLRDIAHFFIYCIVERLKLYKAHDQVFPKLNDLQRALENMNINASFIDG